MRQTLLILSLLVQMLFAPQPAWTQSNYPIYVSPTLLPPYSLKLSDYSAYGSQRMMVTIVVNDLEVANLPVKLRVKMETAGVSIENPITINTTPIYIDGGSATVLFGEDLVDYFNINNLQFKGYSKEAYKRSGQMPEGFYRFSVEVLHFHTNRVISNTGSVTAWIALGKPPVLRTPGNEVELGQYMGVPLTFSWLASNVGSPVSAGSVRYKFEMWEVRVKGINPYTIVSSIPVFHEFVTSSTTYSFNPTGVMMEEGLTYAWRVTAFDESGLVPFEQNGQSEVRTFRYKSLCEEVQAVTTAASGQKGSFTWTPDRNHTSYNVEVRNSASDWFLANETFDSKVEFYKLERGQTYEIRVQAVCNGDASSVSDYTDWTALTIPEAQPKDNTDDCPDCGCSDDLPDVTLSNFELRQDLAPGDTLSNKTGTTRFVVKSVEPQGNGIYKGVFYFWAEIWGVKIPCDFWDLQVNTDNVIVNMDYKSINDPRFLVDVDALIEAGNEFMDNMAVVTTSTAIVDTIPVIEDFDYLVVQDGQLVAIVLNEDGEPIPTPLNITAEQAEKALITNEHGDEVVVTSKGEVMGVKEYQATGGNSRLMKDYKKDKESNELSTGTMVHFAPHAAQKYGFDRYTEEKSALQHLYPTLHNGYRPAFKSVQSFRYDKVGVDLTEGLTFRDEMGVPAIAMDGGVSVQGTQAGSNRAFYAYRALTDSTEELVGKLNVMSFDNAPKRVHIIPVNDAKIPSQIDLETTLNRVYSQAIATWTVVPEAGVTLEFPGGNMTHDGSGGLSTYNRDQEAIVKAYVASGRKLERDDLYLFYVKDATFKDRSLAGYMPLQRQVGFIYGKPTLETVAHELGHGAFNLRHTFSPEALIAQEFDTQNLMDYDGGTELWQHQWDLIHNPESILFAWGQDEEEGAAISMDLILRESSTQNIEFDIEGMITCLTPAGKPYTLPSNVQMLDFTSNSEDQPDGALFAFATDDNRIFSAAFRRSTKEFLGYAEIKRQSNNILDRIDYKDSEKKIPVLREDNLTKSLSDDSRVLIGKVINCAINVYQIEYAQVINKEGVQEDEYYGSGSFDNPISYNLQGKTPISVSDPTACFNAHAKKFYKGHISASSAYKDVLLRIANLINSVEEQGDNVFSDYERYCRAERSERYYGSPETWTPEYYELFANALEAYISDWESLEELILAEKDRDRVTDLTWLLVTKHSTSASYNVRIHALKKLSDAKMWGNPLYGNGEAYLALRIIDLITEKEAAIFIEDLQKDNLMQNISANINNFGVGGDNYTKFIAKLTAIYFEANYDQIVGVYADVEAYYRDRRKNDNLELWFTWRKAFRSDKFNIRYTYKYENNKLIFTTSIGHWVDFNPSWTRNPIDPFEIVIVDFKDIPKHLCDNCLQKDEVLLMPAFLFEWICNEFSNQQIVKYMEGGINVIAIGYGFGALDKGIKLVKALTIIVNSGNLLLMNKDVEQIIIDNLGSEGLQYWKSLSILLDVYNPLAALKYGEAISSFSKFQILWDAFTLTEDYEQLMNSDKSNALMEVQLIFNEFKEHMD